MKKGTIQADIAETLLELGKSTAKQSTQAVNQTINPVKIAEQAVARKDGENSGIDQLTGEKVTQTEGTNSTKLDVKGLKDKYKDQDEVQIAQMRNRLFKLVKEGEEKAILERKKEEEDRQRKIIAEEEEKKKRQQEAQQQPLETPKGKERRSIFAAHKKKAVEQHPETKPSISKG